MSPVYLLSGAGMILVGWGAVVLWKRHYQVPFAFFAWGTAAWTIAVSLKYAVAILMKTPVETYVRGSFPPPIAAPVLWVYIGLLTGIFECGVVLLIVRWVSRIRQARWEEAVAFGMGFGAIEAILVGLGYSGFILLVLFMPERLPAGVIKMVGEIPDSPWPFILPPVVERISALLIHAFTSLLIIYSVIVTRWRWFWFAFLCKTAVDAFAAFLHISYGIENLTLQAYWLVEFVLFVFGCIGAWITWTFRLQWNMVQLNENTGIC